MARDPSSALAGFRIRSLAKGLDRSDPDRLLYPVRALKFYLKRTEHIRAGNKCLFIPLRTGVAHGKLSPNTISSWRKQCIRIAYEVTGQDEALRCPHSVHAHEIRALSASWDLLKNVAVAEIMAACRWRSHNTFFSECGSS